MECGVHVDANSYVDPFQPPLPDQTLEHVHIVHATLTEITVVAFDWPFPAGWSARLHTSSASPSDWSSADRGRIDLLARPA